MSAPAPVAVFVSGTGRHLETLVRLARAGALGAEIRLVVASRAGIPALDRARALDLPAVVIDPERKLDVHAFSERAFAEVERAGCRHVVLAGFLRKLALPPAWRGRVLNIHPSLLPAFGGQGYYGERVHRAVLERGCQVSGCTVHLVDDEYDHGPILTQRAVPVRPDDTVDTLAARVFQAELVALPEALRAHLAQSAEARP